MERYYKQDDCLCYVGAATKHIYSNDYNEVVEAMIEHYIELNHHFTVMLNRYFILRNEIENVEISVLYKKEFERLRLKRKAKFGCKSFIVQKNDKLIIYRKA